MSLDACPSDDELRHMAMTRATKVPVTLGPASPLRQPAPRSGPKGDYTSRRRPKAVEHEIQRALFAWVELPATLKHYPELALFHATPNWFGVGTAIQGARAKAEGRKPGVPDTHLPVARGEYHSLWIEMKSPGKTLTPEQAHWLAALTRHGNKVAIHTTWEGARDELLAYLELPRS